MLEYWIKTNIALLLFYGMYKWFFSSDTFFTLRRYTLLAMSLTALLYPAIDLSWMAHQSTVIQTLKESYVLLLPEVEVLATDTSQAHVFDWKAIASIVYMIIAGMLLLRLIDMVGQVLRIRYKSLPLFLRGIRVRKIRSNDTPFSFFHWIFLNPSLHTENELAEILAHEQVHTTRHHTIDVLLSEFLLLLCWPNPAAWLFVKEIRKNLEFEADSQVVRSGFKSKNYQFHLLRLAQQPTAMAICNHINVSPLKERIIMLNKKKTNPAKRVVYTLLIPVAGLFVMANSATALAVSENVVDKTVAAVEEFAPALASIANPSPQAPKKAEETKAVKEAKQNAEKSKEAAEKAKQEAGAVKQNAEKMKKEATEAKQQVKAANQNINAAKQQAKVANQNANATKQHVETAKKNLEETKQKAESAKQVANQEKEGKLERPVYKLVDTKPEYPGGEAGLLSEIGRNVKYPIKAAENGIQGRVICQFIIEADGSISNPEVIRPVDPDLDKEALRVIKTLKKFTPGKQRGEAVAVSYVIPVMFRLQ